MADIAAEARASLERIQKFDTQNLPREADLGGALNFKDAVEPSERVLTLFRQIPVQYLPELPNNRLNEIKSNSDNFFSILSQILSFDPKTGGYAQRNELINNLKNQYEPTFNALAPMIAYASSRLRDFTALEREARASMQSVTDHAAQLTKDLENSKREANKILDEVRKVAAEQGVSQQAIYFQMESEKHEAESKKWRTFTISIAIGLGFYAVISATAHKWTWLAPSDTYSAIQLGLSKVLIFGVIAYMLLLSARNFLSHKHNAIVNKHRQNALLTFNALAHAAGKEESRDIVLTHAAACIFSPQETGYIRTASVPQSEFPMNIIQTLPKISGGAH